MKTVILILAFALIGMVTDAQVVVKVDSLKVGDELIFDKESRGIIDIYNTEWEFPKGASVVVTDIHSYNEELISVDVVDNFGREYVLFADEIKYNEDKKRLHVCR